MVMCDMVAVAMESMLKSRGVKYFWKLTTYIMLASVI